MSKTIPTVLLLASLLAGCQDKTPDKPGAPLPTQASSGNPSDAVESSRKLILRYNKLLSDGYKTTNMTTLQEVATKELAEKAFYHMAAIGEGKSRLVSDLKKISFDETDCSKPARCRVVTKETWDFGYADLLTGKRSNEVNDYIYHVQYVLEIREGHWLLTEINATGEERKELPAWDKMFKKQ